MRTWLLSLVLLATGAFAGEDIDALLAEGRYGEAVPAAERAAIESPDDIEAQERWIDIMLSLGRPEVLERGYQARVAASPDDPNAHYLLGRALVNSDASRLAYEAALRLDPEHARSFMGMGAVHKAAGRQGDAVAAYRNALDRDGTLAEAWGGLLSLYVAAGRIDEAKELAEVAMLQVSHLVEPYLVYAALEPEHSHAVLLSARERAPLDARVRTTLAESFLDRGEPKQALAEAVEAIRLRPMMNGPRLAQMFARSMAAGQLDVAGYKALVSTQELERTDRPAARARYDQLVTSYPKSPLPWMSRARVRVEDDPAGARADLERALSMDPEVDEAQAGLGLLLLGEGEFDRAVRLLEPVADARPHDASLQVAAARAAFGAGARKRALKRLSVAQEAHPYHVDTVLHRAHMLSEEGDKEAAYQLIRIATEQMPDLRLAMARAAAAKDSGRLDEAIDIYTKLAKGTGKDVFAETAELIRQERDAR